MSSVNKKIKVNFLRDRKRRVRRERVLFAKIQTVALVGLGIYSVILFTMMGLKQVASNTLDKVNEEIDQEKQTLVRLAPVEAQAILIDNKLSLLRTYYKENLAIRQAMMQLYTSLPQGVEVQALSFGEEKDAIDVEAEAESVFVVENLLPTLRQWWQDTLYSSIRMQGLSRREDASYQVSGSFSLGESAPKLVDLLEGNDE